VEVGILGITNLVVEISMGGILSATLLGDIFQPPFDTVVGIKGLKILDLRPTDFCAAVNKIALGTLGAISAV
jgi:hypothetical protein